MRNGVNQCIKIALNDLHYLTNVNLNNVKNVSARTTNIIFEHLVISSKGFWGQKSPKVIQGHLGSLSVKNKIIAIPHNTFKL